MTDRSWSVSISASTDLPADRVGGWPLIGDAHSTLDGRLALSVSFPRVEARSVERAVAIALDQFRSDANNALGTDVDMSSVRVDVHRQDGVLAASQPRG